MAFATIELDAQGAVGSIELSRPDCADFSRSRV